MARRRLWVAGVSILALLAACLLAGLFPQEPLRWLVERRLRSTLGPKASLGALHVVPATLAVEVRDLVLDAPSFRLELPRGRVDLSAGSILSRLLPGRWRGEPRPFEIHALELDSPRIELRASADGTGNGESLPAIVVEQLDLNGGTLTYSATDPAAGAEARGVEVHGSVGHGRLLATLREATWKSAPDVPLGPARAEISVSPGLEIDVASLTAQVGRSRLQARGPLGGPGSWTPKLDLSARLDLADLAAFGAPSLGGALEVQGRLTGPVESAAFGLDAHGSQLDLGGWRVDEAHGRLSGRVNGTASASWTLRLAPGQVEGEAHLSGEVTDGSLRFTDVDLGRLIAPLGGAARAWRGRASGEARWSGDLGSTVQVTARAQASLLAEGHSALASLEVSGPVDLKRQSVDLEWGVNADSPPPAVATAPAATAPAAASPGLVAAHLRASGRARGTLPPAVQGRVDGDLSFSTPGGPADVTVGGKVKSDAEGASAELAMLGLGGSLRLSAELKEGSFRRLEAQGESLSLEPLGADGTARLALAASGPWNRLSGDAHLDVAGAAWKGVSLGDVSVAAESRAGDVEASFVVPELQARGHARLPSAAPATLSASLELDGSHIETLAPLWPDGVVVSGAVTGRVDATVPLDHPRATEAEAHVDTIRLESGAWSVESRGPFVVRAREERVAVDGLSLAGPGLRLELSGSAGTGRDSSLDVAVQADVDLEQAPPVPGVTWDGALEARVRLSGGLDRPRASGFVSAHGLTIQGERLPPLAIPDGRIDLDADAIVARRLSAQVAGGEVKLDGRVPLTAVVRAARRDEGRVSPGEGAALALTFEGVDMAPLVARLQANHASPVAGRLSGRLDLEGGLSSLDEARASLRVTPEAVAVEDLPLDVSPLGLTLKRGEVILDSATVAAQGGQLTVGGRVDLERRTVDATARGELRLRALSPFLPDAAVSGRGELDLAVSGPLEAPEARGVLTVHEGTLRLRALPQSVTGVDARLVLDGRTVRVESASAALGGGSLSLAGTAALAADSPDVDLRLSGKDVALRYPEGLRSRLDADLRLRGKPGELVLTGSVRAQRGLYDLDVALEQSLLSAPVESEPSPLLRSIALDLRVDTVNPVLIRNNLAQLDATGSLNMLGDLETPAPVGRLDLRAGGRVFLQQREFTIESGRLTYDGTWDPEVSLRAKAVLRGVDLGVYGRQDVEVQVQISGPLAQPRMTFSSDPGGYSEAEIVTMIVTNRARSRALSSGAWVAGEQTALFLTGRLTRGLTSELRGLGLDEVTIQPELLARETDPGARFTFGKHLTDELRLIYSLSLNDPENRFVELDLDPGGDVNLLAQRRDDGSFTLGAGQRVRFFGRSRRPAYREPKVRVEEVAVEVHGTVGEKAVREILHTRAGKAVSEWDLQDDAERVRESLRARGYIEAEVTARSEGGKAAFRVDSGPRFEWRIEGMADAPALDETVQGSLFEDEALERGCARLLETLHQRGYLEARVEATATSADGNRTLVFVVAPGLRLRVRAVLFPGATRLSTDRLLEVAGGASRLLSDPDAARRAIRAAYHDRYYLAVEVQPPVVSRRGDELTISVSIDEGPPARVKAVRFAGTSQGEDSLARAARIVAGTVFDPALVPEAVVHLRDLYYSRGYPNARISARIETVGSDLDVVFDVSAGEHLSVGAIEIAGLGKTREAFVRRAIGFLAGDPLDPRRLAAAERKLLALGAFSRASVTHSGGDPAAVRVELEEEPRLVAGYQARYNDDRGLSGDLDGEVRNLLGRGLALGARYSRGKDDEQIRGSIQLPSLAFLGNLTGSLFRNSKELPVIEDGPTFLQLEKGLELQVNRPLPDRWSLLYGYRFKTSRVTSELDEFGTNTRIASLDVSLLRDTRDNALNAHRGRFWSVNLEIAPRALASDLDFVKGMAQLFATRSLGPSLVWAQGYRLGLAHVFSGDRLLFSERFQAGGGNSIRGFATDSVGPRTIFEEPAGGEAVLVLNQELRYMHPWGLGGVVFWDAGNVFAKANDLSLDLRHALGAGLRWDSPVGLLRVDVGFPLERRADEKPYRLFFSLGQAF